MRIFPPRVHSSIHALALAVLLTFAGCGGDESVVAPPAPGDGGGADTDAGSVDGGEQLKPAVDFYIEIAGGDALKSSGQVALKLSQDKHTAPGDTGFQVNVVVTTTDIADGAAVTVKIDGGQSYAGTVSGGLARVDKVTLPCAPKQANITVSAAGAEAVKSYTLLCDDQCVVEVAAVDGCLTQDQDTNTPGLQHAFKVISKSPGCETVWLKVTDVAGVTKTTDTVELQGQADAMITATLADSDSGVVGKEATVVAFAKDKDHPGRPEGQSGPVTVKITTDKPTLGNLQPASGTLNLSNDADKNPDNGLDITLEGTAETLTPSDTDAIVIEVGSKTYKTKIDVTGKFTQALTFTQSGDYTVKITATNSCGLTDNVEIKYTVYVDEATLTLTTPAPKSVLLAKDDGDKATADVYETDFVVGIQGGTGGSELSVWCRKNAIGAVFLPAALGTAVYNAGDAQVKVPVKLPVAATGVGTDVACEVRDNAPNPAKSAEVAFKVGLPAPCLKLALPEDGAATKLTSLPVAAEAEHLDGAKLVATMVLTNALKFGPTVLGEIKSGGFAGSLSLLIGSPPKPIPDGDYTLTVEATDGFGNKASDSACSSVTRKVTLDTTAPVVKLTAPGVAKLDPLVHPDANAAVPGYQVQVEASVSGEKTGAVVEVCLSVGAFKVKPCQKTGPGKPLVTFKDVTLTAGTNPLVLTATDAVGNTVTNPPVNIELVSNAVKVKMLQPPTQSVAVATDTITLKARISESDETKPISGAIVAVYLDDKPYANVKVSEGADGVYTIVLSGLAAGVHKVRVGAKPKQSAEEGFGQEITVTYKTTKPVIGIDSPVPGAVFNLASAACVAGAADCIQDVVASVTNAADGSEAELSVDCGKGKPAVLKGSVAGGKVTFKQATLKNNSTCSLIVKVTDEAGQTASSAAVKVTIDRSAPVFIAMFAPKGDVVLADKDIDANPSNGMQTEVVIQAEGVPAGSKVTLKIYGDDGKLHSEPKIKAFTPIPDGQKGLLNWGVISLPEGEKVKLVFEAVDPLGNVAKVFEKILHVIASKPDVRLISPVFVANDACTKTADCKSGICAPDGKCALPWGKSATREVGMAVIGLPVGAKVRVCSNSPAVKGGACATAGFKVVAEGVTQLSNTVMDVSGVVDGVHTFVAEALTPGDDPAKAASWTRSMASPQPGTHYRQVYIDTAPPTLVACLPPQIKGVPAGCLSRKSQTNQADLKPGGTFSIVVTTTGPGDAVTVFDTAGHKATATTDSKKLAGVPLTLPEGKAVLKAQAVDIVGNVSAELSCGTHTVNTVAPDLKFLAPTKSPLIAGDKLDVTLATQAADAEAQPVVLLDGAKTIGSVAVKGGQVTFAHALYKTLTDGDHTLTATVKDDCGNVSAAAGTAPSQITVDTLAPTASIKSPAQGAQLADKDDASAAVGGYQVDAVFGCGGAVSWKLELGTDCDAAYASCASHSAVASGPVTNGGGDEPKRQITVPFGKTPQYSLRLTCVDDHGNETTASRGFAVKVSGCLVSVSGLPSNGVINNGLCAKKGEDCAIVTLKPHVQYIGPCGDVTAIKLMRDDVEKQSAKPVSSAATFTSQFKDGEAFVFEARVFAGSAQKGSSGPQKIVVDLTAPKVAFIKTKVLGVETPASGENLLWGKSADLDGAKNGHQFHAALKIDDAALAGGKLLELVYDPGTGTTVPLGAAGVATPMPLKGKNSQTVELKFATVAENAPAQVVAKVQDAAGNTATTAFGVTVDWVPPAKIAVDPFKAGDINPRRPYAVLNFKAVADNGTGGKAAAGYEVRYSRKPIADLAAFEAACDAKTLPGSTIGKPAAPGAADKVMVEGPDGRGVADLCQFAPAVDNGATKYHFSVRAVDAAGNKGPISDAVSTADIRLRYAKLSGTSTWNNLFLWGFPIGLGDINGDGKMDVGAGAFGDFCFVYGHADSQGAVADLSIGQQTGPNHGCIKEDKSFGYRVAAPIDVNGDGVHDLVIAYGKKVSGDTAASMREVRVYLGQKGKPITSTPAVTLKNITCGVSIGVRALASAGNFNGDKSSSGGAIDDIAFTVDKTAAHPYERVMILPGSQSWSTASPITIDVESAADRAKHDMAVIHRMDSVGTPNFGITLAAAGDVLKDAGDGAQYDDLLIGQYATTTHLIVLKGQPLKGETVFELSASNNGKGAADGKTVRLFAHGTGVVNFTSAASVEFDGDPTPDIVALQASNNEQPWLYWIRGKALAGKEGKALVLAGSAVSGLPDVQKTALGYKAKASFVNVANAGNFADLSGSSSHTIVGQRPKWVSGGGQTWVPLRHALKRGAPLSSEASYHELDMKIGDPFTPGSTAFTAYRVVPVGDFNGDGFPDLVVGTKAKYAVLVY